MKHLFLIPGYGIPKNILRDFQYNRYLPIAFNHIYQSVLDRKAEPVVVLSGGPTDMFPPYRRTEAREMLRFFNVFRKKLPSKRGRGWRVFPEATSLSTLENLLETKKLLKRKNIRPHRVTIFCEATRTARMRQLARKIFVGQRITVVPIDFDVSLNRYLDPAFLDKKERKVARGERWALRSPAHFRRYHKLLQEKIAFLRKRGAKRHANAVKGWWEQELRKAEII